MGIQNRPRITVTVKGELVGDRILRAGTVIYSVLPNPDVPKYDTCFFLLQKVGYVYAILNYVVLSLHNKSNKVRNEHGEQHKVLPNSKFSKHSNGTG
jgi:hypothetical protein|nr:MAG TPA: hypothetical protein [Caudoviricetes sp.]